MCMVYTCSVNRTRIDEDMYLLVKLNVVINGLLDFDLPVYFVVEKDGFDAILQGAESGGIPRCGSSGPRNCGMGQKSGRDLWVTFPFFVYLHLNDEKILNFVIV